jgi:hypothetical protein
MKNPKKPVFENCYIVVSTIFGPSGPDFGPPKSAKNVIFTLPLNSRKSFLKKNVQKCQKSGKFRGELL